MKLIACVDNNMGMMFNKRRQSRDSKVIDEILKISKSTNVYMSEYSHKMIKKIDFLDIENEKNNRIDDKSYIFVEDYCLDIDNSKLDEIILFKWNRDYPADKYFNISLEKWSLVEKRDFEGTSHEMITMEKYIK